MNDTPLRDSITPYYANSGLLKFRVIFRLHTCLFFYGHLCENKPTNFPVILVSEITITLRTVLPLNYC